MTESVKYNIIGVIHTPFKDKENTPIQGCFAPDKKGQIEVFPEYAAGLKDIAPFSHLILIYHFHKAEECELVTKPFLDKEKRGIFAIRFCNRPNPIGITVVRLNGVINNILDISGVDMLDGTPLLDIKPYVPQFDIKENVCDGWYRKASERARYEI